MDDNVDITLLKRIRNSEKFANALLVIRNKPDFSSLSFRIPEGKNLHAHDLDLTALKSIKSLIKAYNPSKQEKQLEILKVPQF